MTQIAYPAGGSLSNVYPHAADATSLAELARAARSGSADRIDVGGFAIESDRIGVARSARFAAEIETAGRAAANASHGVSLLGAADDALAEIADRLETLAALAEQAADPSLSPEDRARLDTEFRSVRDEIDRLASQAEFGGAALLEGDGAGASYRVEYRVGTGTDSSDRIEVEIGSARVEDLSEDLAAADIRTEASAAAAADAVEEAQDRVADIRARIAGDRERLGTAYLSAQDRAGAHEDARAALSDPTVAADLARIVAERLADESVVPLSADADRQIRSLLSRLGTVEAPARDEQPSTGDSARAARDETPQPLTPEPAASRPSG